MQHSNLLEHFPRPIGISLGEHADEPASSLPPEITSGGRGTSQPSPAFQGEFIFAEADSKLTAGFKHGTVARPFHQNRLVEFEGAASIFFVAIGIENCLSRRSNAGRHRKERTIFERFLNRRFRAGHQSDEPLPRSHRGPNHRQRGFAIPHPLERRAMQSLRAQSGPTHRLGRVGHHGKSVESDHGVFEVVRRDRHTEASVFEFVRKVRRFVETATFHRQFDLCEVPSPSIAIPDFLMRCDLRSLPKQHAVSASEIHEHRIRVAVTAEQFIGHVEERGTELRPTAGRRLSELLVDCLCATSPSDLPGGMSLGDGQQHIQIASARFITAGDPTDDQRRRTVVSGKPVEKSLDQIVATCLSIRGLRSTIDDQSIKGDDRAPHRIGTTWAPGSLGSCFESISGISRETKFEQAPSRERETRRPRFRKASRVRLVDRSTQFASGRRESRRRVGESACSSRLDRGPVVPDASDVSKRETVAAHRIKPVSFREIDHLGQFPARGQRGQREFRQASRCSRRRLRGIFAPTYPTHRGEPKPDRREDIGLVTSRRHGDHRAKLVLRGVELLPVDRRSEPPAGDCRKNRRMSTKRLESIEPRRRASMGDELGAGHRHAQHRAGEIFKLLSVKRDVLGAGNRLVTLQDSSESEL